MKQLLLRLFDLVTWPFAHCGWPALCLKCSIAWRNLYAAYIRHQCHRCGELKLGSTDLHLSGLPYMDFGDRVELQINALESSRCLMSYTLLTASTLVASQPIPQTVSVG